MISARQKEGRPNFLVIMVDQQRGDCLGIENHPVLLTPNMDNIGANGVRFTHCYSTCPVCQPARRSLLSGQFPATHGLLDNVDGADWDAPPTLPGVLRNAGYQTYLVGRDMHQFPPRKRYGFDHMVTSTLSDSAYGEWLESQLPGRGAGYYTSGAMHNDWTGRPWHLDESLHMTNWIVNESMQFLRKRDPSCPFFLVVSFLAPHPPLLPPLCYLERYRQMELPEPAVGDWAVLPPNGGIGDDIGSSRVHLSGEALRSCRAAYYGLINHIDDQLRRLLNPVSGVDRITDDNTVVIFTSDHGEMLGDHYLWRKSLPYEGAARVPLLVRIPACLAPELGFKASTPEALPNPSLYYQHPGANAGLVIEEPTCLEDIMPTILDIAGVQLPETVEGQSLLPLMRGEEIPWRPYIHIECSPIHHSLTDGKQKYIWFTEDGREQFFDLLTDPKECHDLSSNPKMVSHIDRWRELLIKELKNRPEGFSDGQRLIPGRPYPPVLYDFSGNAP